MNDYQLVHSMNIHLRYIPIVFFLSCVVVIELMVVGNVRAHADSKSDSVSDTRGRDTSLRVEAIPAPESPMRPTIPPIVPFDPLGALASPAVPSGASLLPPRTPPPSTPNGQRVEITLHGTTSTLDLTDTPVSQIGGHIGYFIKCEVLTLIGWPLPPYLAECIKNGTTTPPTPPPGSASLTIRKHSGDFDDVFGFTLSGVSAGTTSVATTGGTGALGLIVSPGTTTLSEDARSGWVLESLGCTQGALPTGFAVGSTSWTLFLPAGAGAVCDFANVFVGGQGGGDDDGGGGGPPGGGENPPGGGGGPPSGGTPPAPGGNGPIAGSFDPGSAPPSVLGASAKPEVEGVGGYNPEMPDTGLGGNALTLLLTLLALFSGALISFAEFVRGIRRAY